MRMRMLLNGKTLLEKLPSVLKKYIRTPADFKPKKNRKLMHLFFTLHALFACFVYYADMAGDIFLLVNYNYQNQMLYFGLSLAFVLLQVVFVQVFMTLFGINLILSTFCDSMYTRAKPTGCRLVSRVLAFILIDLMCLFQVHIFFMYMTLIVLYFTYDEADFEEIFYVLSKILMIFNLFEMYLESVPQFALQFYIFVDTLVPKTVTNTTEVVINLIGTNNSSNSTTIASEVSSTVVYATFTYVQGLQLISIIFSAISISYGLPNYYYKAFVRRVKLYKFISFFLQFSIRLCLCVFLYRLWGWPVLVIAILQLIVDFLHIFKRRDSDLIRLSFLSLFNIITILFEGCIFSSDSVNSKRRVRTFAVLLWIVYFLENLTLCVLFAVFYREFALGLVIALAIIFVLGHCLAIFFEFLIVFNFRFRNIDCSRQKCCCCCKKN